MNQFKIIPLLLLLVNVGLGQIQNEAKTEQQIDSILNQMTLEEKVALCHAQSKFSVSGVPRLGIPELWMSDGPHGVRAEIAWDSWDYAGWTNDSVTAFPALTCLAATFNPKLSHAYGVAVGEEARYRKKDILLGPGVNIYRTPLNGRNFEYMGEDPFLASKLVVPYIRGVQQNGVAACVKHFVLNNQEKWRGHINVEVSDRALHEIYLPAFKAAIEEGKAWSIMGAYNQFRGQHCCHNEYLLNTILKKHWAFDGVVITDWGGAHDTKQAALYGLDIEMGTGTNGLTYSTTNAYENYYLAGAFRTMLFNGDLKMELVDEKVRRILRLMFRTNLNANKPLGSLNTTKHKSVARDIAEQGIVLLQNQQGMLPLSQEKMTLLVVGENAIRPMTKGGGSSELKAQQEIAPLQGIKDQFPNANVQFTYGYSSGPAAYGRTLAAPHNQDSLFTKAVQLAKNADKILFIGGLNKNHLQDCEGGDRIAYQLPYGQPELIEALAKENEHIAVVLISGNAVKTSWRSKVKSVVQAWYLGSEAGNALANILSGKTTPSGKLPFSFPEKLKDNAAHHFGERSYPGDSITQLYQEGILVGYRWHDSKNIAPAFAFGHGLSYTNFTIHSIELNQKTFSEKEPIQVSYTLSNTGKVKGEEVVQVYIGKINSEVARAKKELKGYTKTELQPGQTAKLTITIDPQALRYFNEKEKGWALEKGAYYLYIGNASDSITKKIKFNLQ